jgi:Flp pilus assembly protein TadD
MDQERHEWLRFALLIIFPLLLYVHTSSFGYSEMDDIHMIVRNADFLRDFSNIGTIFVRDAFLNSEGEFYRPLQSLSYMLDIRILGLEPYAFHISSVFFHLVTVVSLYLLLLQLRIKNQNAFFISLLFAVHPLVTPAITWIPARGDLLLGLCSIWSFSFFIKFLDHSKLSHLILSCLFFILALLAKETALSLVLVCITYVMIFRRDVWNFKKTISLVLSWIIVFIMYASLRLQIHIPPTAIAVFGLGPFLENFSAIPSVIGSFFFPLHLSTLPSYESGSIIWGSLCWFVLFFLAWQLKENDRRWVLFGLIWFLLFFIPPLFFKSPLTDKANSFLEHRTYLPVIGVFFTIVPVIPIVLHLFNQYFVRVILGVGVLALCYLSYSRSNDYRDAITFNDSALRQNPRNAIAWNNRGSALKDRGKLNEALQNFSQALVVRPEYVEALANKASVELLLGNDQQAFQDLSEALNWDTTMVEALVARSEIMLRRRDFQGVIEDCSRAIMIDNQFAPAYFYRGIASLELSKFQIALENFTHAIVLNPNEPDFFNNRAFTLISLGDYPAAIDDCQRALLLQPTHAGVYYTMGIAYNYLGKKDDAYRCWNQSAKFGSLEASSLLQHMNGEGGIKR